MIFPISYGQVVQNQHEDSIEVKMEKLKIQAQHEMDSVKFLYEIERNGIKTEAKDSLSNLQFMGESELAAAQLKVKEIESRYHKEMALLELKMKQ